MTIESLKKFTESQGWTDFAILPIAEVQKALQKHEGVFEKWVEKGYQASMEYLEKMKEDRFHPQNKLPDVRSAIVLVAWYDSDGGRTGADSGRIENGLNTNRSPSKSYPKLFGTHPKSIRNPSVISSGKVARYAQGRDYHKILKKKLIRLSDWIKSQNPEVQTYASVDSGPTVDRVLADVAGLGFFGKNSMIINPRRGSYFFIASLMTNLELEPTEKKPMPNCGNCNKCMVACPTKAIVAPGVIDARRCISYLTIESKEGIAPELRPLIGDRLFGCDICQEVCPFNIGRAGRQEVRIPEIRADKGAGATLDVRELLAIESDEQFLSRFAGTPLMRAKRRGLLRNACVVAGNSGDASLISDLQNFLDYEQDKMLREHAQWAIIQLKNQHDY